MRITIFVSALVFSLILTSCGSVYAQSSIELINSFDASPSANLGESLIYPASPLYFLKAIREKIEVLLDSNDEIKAIRQVEFMQRRLREVTSLIKHNRQDLIPETLEQYKVNLKNLGSIRQSEEVQIEVAEAVSEHLDVLQRLFGSTGDTRAQQAIRATILRSQDFNMTALSKLSLPKQQLLIGKIAQNQTVACKFITKEADSSAISDTEREYLSTQAKKCQEDVMVNLKDQLLELLKQKQLQSTSSATSR